MSTAATGRKLFKYYLEKNVQYRYGVVIMSHNDFQNLEMIDHSSSEEPIGKPLSPHHRKLMDKLSLINAIIDGD